jgi:hypothetical protein
VLGIPYLFLSKREALFRPRGINMEFQRDKRRYLIFQDEFGLIVEISLLYGLCVGFGLFITLQKKYVVGRQLIQMKAINYMIHDIHQVHLK